MKKIGIFLLLFLVVLVVGKNTFIKMTAEVLVKQKTGMNLNIDKFQLGLLSSKIQIERMELFNTARFDHARMASVPEINIDMALTKLFANQLYFKNITLNLQEFTVIKNKEGEVNFKELAIYRHKEKKKAKKKKAQKKKSTFFAESLELRIDKVVVKDYTAPDPPSIREYNLKIDRKYKNIRNYSVFWKLLLAEILTKTTLANLSEMDMKEVQKFSAAAAKKGIEVTGKAVKTGAKSLKKLEQKTEQSLEKLLIKGKNLIPGAKE